MHISEEGLRQYIETFHHTLATCAEKYLPPECLPELFHLSLLPAKITGYVSTQFGLAIEYEPATKTTIQVTRGSGRIEDLLVKAPSRVRDIGPMFRIPASGCSFANLTLSGAFPFRLTTNEASVSFEDIGFEAGPWKRIIHFAEVFGTRDVESWSVGKAESRAKDEVLAATLHLNRASQRKMSVSEYMQEFKSKTVLLLGDYDKEGIIRLESLSKGLSGLGYEPILVKDIPDHPHHDVPQKVVAIGAICRFVVVDDSSKSGHLLEVQLCKQNSWVTILLRAGGIGGSWMTAGASHASNVILEASYNPLVPEKTIKEATEWAETKLKELEKKFESTYPWRKGGQAFHR